MAKKAYLGVENLPKNVSQIYLGINNLPKKVIKGYVGVNGVPKVFWDGGGINANVIYYNGSFPNSPAAVNTNNIIEMTLNNLTNGYISAGDNTFSLYPDKLINVHPNSNSVGGTVNEITLTQEMASQWNNLFGTDGGEFFANQKILTLIQEKKENSQVGFFIPINRTYIASITVRYIITNTYGSNDGAVIGIATNNNGSITYTPNSIIRSQSGQTIYPNTDFNTYGAVWHTTKNFNNIADYIFIWTFQTGLIIPKIYIEGGEIPSDVVATAIHYSNVSSTGICSSSSVNTLNTNLYAPWKAFKRTADFDGWSPSGSVGQWLQYKFSTPRQIIKITIMNRTWRDSFGVKKFDFQASNDGTTWITLAECTMSSSANVSGYSQDFYISNNNKYIYYRVYILESFQSGVVMIGCLNMYEPRLVF